jgi:hypothetical protein
MYCCGTRSISRHWSEQSGKTALKQQEQKHAVYMNLYEEGSSEAATGGVCHVAKIHEKFFKLQLCNQNPTKYEEN